MLTLNADKISPRVDTAQRRATASKYSALILEASGYMGCAKSSAMTPGRGRSAAFSASAAFALIF
jgi:hypothetical protein